MPRIRPEDRYLSMPSAEAGGASRGKEAWIRRPWLRSMTHRSVAWIRSPGATTAARPTKLTMPANFFLVNRRMTKSQPMRWSRRGADLLPRGRCAVLNGKLGSGFGQLFEANPASDLAMAA